MRGFIIYIMLKIYLQIILSTCRWRVHNENLLLGAINKNSPLMLCCWHERLLFLVCFFKKFKPPLWVISSQHKDSEILGRILNLWGFRFIKGSSSRGWFSVTKHLIKLFKNPQTIIAITNDGPKGPAKKAKSGALNVALKHNAQILGMSAVSSKFWTLNTWDRIKLPKPFSTIHVGFYVEYKGSGDLSCFNTYLNKNQNHLDGVARGFF